MKYTVGGEEFTYDLPGLTKAIKFAQELAYDGPVDVMKTDGEDSTLAYRVHKQEPKQREGHVDVAPEHRRNFQ